MKIYRLVLALLGCIAMNTHSMDPAASLVLRTIRSIFFHDYREAIQYNKFKNLAKQPDRNLNSPDSFDQSIVEAALKKYGLNSEYNGRLRSDQHEDVEFIAQHFPAKAYNLHSFESWNLEYIDPKNIKGVEVMQPRIMSYEYNLNEPDRTIRGPVVEIPSVYNIFDKDHPDYTDKGSHIEHFKDLYEKLPRENFEHRTPLTVSPGTVCEAIITKETNTFEGIISCLTQMSVDPFIKIAKHKIKEEERANKQK